MSGNCRVDADGYLEPVTVSGKAELIQVLEYWLKNSTAETVGNPKPYGGRPHTEFPLGGHEAHLNADTKRNAVEAAVRANRGRRLPLWRIVANRNKKFNKILPWSEKRALKGWYAYLKDPIDSETTL